MAKSASIRVVATVAAVALVFSLASVFMYQHTYMSTALDFHKRQHIDELRSTHREAMALGESDWDAVWQVAQGAQSRADFITAVTAAGINKGSSSAPQGGELKGLTLDGAPQQTACPTCALCTACPACASCTACPSCPAQQQQAPADPKKAFLKFLEGTGGEPPPISGPLARAVSMNNSIIVTWANYALWDFVQTWIKHVQDLGMSNFLVGAMDAQIGKELVSRGLPCFAMYDVSSGKNHSGVGADHLQWGGESFHKMGRQKINLAKLFLGLGLDLLLVDVDVVILGDVMGYFARYPQADILVTSDQLASTTEVGDDGLELPTHAQSPMNIGFMWFKYSQRTVTFVDKWLEAINADPLYWDQNAFNDLARSGWDPANKVEPANKRIFIGANGTLSVGVLPVASFSGGHTFFIQHLYQVQRVKPMAVHCTFQMGANPGKRNRLREMTLFEDPPEYWTGDSYISVELGKLPSATWDDFQKRNATDMKRYHYKGLDMQLGPVWASMKVAAAFNRSIIVPRLACYCDRYWTELDKCRVPGAFKERIPFLCPMDHVLDPIFMKDDVSKFVVRWREHSFLENPRCPDWLKRSKLTIYTSASVTKPLERYVVQEGGTVLMLPGNLTSGALKELLAPYSAFKIWHLKDAQSLFAGFDDAALGEEVRKRIEHLVPIMPPDPSPPPPPNGTAAAPAGAATGKRLLQAADVQLDIMDGAAQLLAEGSADE